MHDYDIICFLFAQIPEEGFTEPVGTGNFELALELSEHCDRLPSSEAWELADLLRSPHLRVSQ